MPKRKPTPPKPDTDTLSLLPMELRPGDTFTDEAGTWEVVGRPTMQRGGKDVKLRVQHPGEPVTLREQWWPAHLRVTVARAAAT